jgi:hypothetical protein
MRVHRKFAAIAVAAAVLSGVVASTAQAQPWHNAGSGLCMTSLGTKTNGDPAEQWGCNGSLNQWWYQPNGPWLEGLPIVNSGDHKCLNNRGGQSYDYNYETMWSCSADSGTPNWKEQYEIIPDRFHQSYWWIETLNSNYYPTSYCLSSLGDKTYGSTIAVYHCNSSLNQAWFQG